MLPYLFLTLAKFRLHRWVTAVKIERNEKTVINEALQQFLKRTTLPTAKLVISRLFQEKEIAKGEEESTTSKKKKKQKRRGWGGVKNGWPQQERRVCVPFLPPSLNPETLMLFV